jgi:putative transposase
LGVRQDNPKGQGTAVTKTYQMNDVAATELAVPEQVMLSMAGIAEDMREGLLALAVGAGLQVMSTLMDADVTAICGPRGRHDRQRVAGAAWHRTGLGDPGRAAGAGHPAAGARGGRLG